MDFPYQIVSIHDFFDEKDGEAIYQNIVQNFDSINSDIKDFLLHKAFEFAMRKQAITYLVMSGNCLVGYFTLALKTLEIPAGILSKSATKKIERMCVLNISDNSYRPPAYLIAQLGKNFCKDISIKIDGSVLLQIANDTIRNIQSLIGGVISFLECENNEKLIAFYNKNGFVELGSRTSSNCKELIQLYKMI